MIVADIEWICESAKEAMVKVCGGKVCVNAFAHPCEFELGDEVTSNLHIFGLRAATLSSEADTFALTQSDGMSHHLRAIVVDTCDFCVRVDGFIFEIDDPMPGDLNLGDVLDIYCGRIDIW